MELNVSDQGIIAFKLQDGRVLNIPNFNGDQKILPNHHRFHSYDVDSVVGFRSFDAWNKEFGEHVGRPFDMGPTNLDSTFMALRHVPAPENLFSVSHIQGAAVNTGDTTTVPPGRGNAVAVTRQREEQTGQDPHSHPGPQSPMACNAERQPIA